ncbi:hypothetical protein OROGR_025312 [Orobanche gracilis]
MDIIYFNHMSAAAFAKGLLDLEGQLTPILYKNIAYIICSLGGPKRRRLTKAHAGSILTTLFAVSCSASIEDAASLDYDVDLVVHAAGPFEYADSKLLEAAIESKTACVDIADHEGFARCPKSYKNKAIAAGVPAITNAEANPGVSSLMAATLIHNAQRESKGQPERLRYHYFTAGSGGNGPGVLATSFYLIADEVVTYYKGAKMMLKPYIDKLNIDFGEGIRNKDVFLMNRTFEGQKHSSTVVETILSIIRAVDKISEKSMICSVQGYNAAAIFSHERLAEAVGTATTAFVSAVLEETQSLEFGILKRRRLTKVDAVSCSASIEDAASLDYVLPLMLINIADHEGFARRAKSYKNKAIAAGVPAITNAGANPRISSLMAATFIHNAQRESKGQPERLRYHYFTTGSGGNGPGVLATSFYLIADEVVTNYKGAKMMLKPYSDKLSIDF